MPAPLIAPLPAAANSEVAQLAAFFNGTLGFCPNSVLTMQHRPAFAAALIELNKAVMANHGRVSSAPKRLVGYLSSFTAGCTTARPTPYWPPHGTAPSRSSSTTSETTLPTPPSARPSGPL